MNAENLLEAIKSLEGEKIDLFISENQSVHGTLLSVQEDHLIVKAGENILYFPITQIKALSKNVKETSLKRNAPIAPMNRVKLEEILKTMYLQWITVNSFNNQSFSGVLSKVTEDYILLINGERQYFVLKSQISNVINEQINETQIASILENGIATNAFDDSPLSNLARDGSQLTEQQRRGISEATFIPERLSDKENEQTAAGETTDHPIVAAIEKNMPEEQSSQKDKAAIQAEFNQPAFHKTPSSEESMVQVQNTQTQQGYEVMEQALPKQKSTKKMQKRRFFQELKFNSPIQSCTWDVKPVEVDFSYDKNEEMDARALKKTENFPAENIAGILENDYAIRNTHEPLEEPQPSGEEEVEIQTVSGENVAAPPAEIVEENLESMEYTSSSEEESIHEPIKMLMEDNRRLLKYQYYALMKFAERMYHMESQYRALMKHAEKMYMQLKERRFY